MGPTALPAICASPLVIAALAAGFLDERPAVRVAAALEGGVAGTALLVGGRLTLAGAAPEMATTGIAAGVIEPAQAPPMAGTLSRTIGISAAVTASWGSDLLSSTTSRIFRPGPPPFSRGQSAPIRSPWATTSREAATGPVKGWITPTAIGCCPA